MSQDNDAAIIHRRRSHHARTHDEIRMGYSEKVEQLKQFNDKMYMLVNSLYEFPCVDEEVVQHVNLAFSHLKLARIIAEKYAEKNFASAVKRQQKMGLREEFEE